jgi:hypothetical protein
MSVGGTWKLTMQTPLGERGATLALAEAGSDLTGRLTSEEGASTDVVDGKADGDRISFKAAIKNPMPLTLAFTATVAGDKITGSVSASGLGSWAFQGSRG